MTDPDYFHTSKLYYAAAAIEQGFIGLYLNADTYDFPRTPHNVALMELQVGDLVKFNNYKNTYGTVIEIHNEGRSIYVSNNPEYTERTQFAIAEDLTSVMRNNIPFPVWDKDGA